MEEVGLTNFYFFERMFVVFSDYNDKLQNLETVTIRANGI